MGDPWHKQGLGIFICAREKYALSLCAIKKKKKVVLIELSLLSNRRVVFLNFMIILRQRK